ncbi:macrophage mannose receptor 1-like [Schistocerca nitens]|uniref:macrophage mannose receptor 1-like n=1 Tax=Schistocerca nitens TaxID=7011 RepID=UPI002117621F|nr:macrophage mannose receptor 1-like [Schistocerca nitens]
MTLRTAAAIAVAALCVTSVAAVVGGLDQRIRCGCRVVGFGHVQIDIGCGYSKANAYSNGREGKNITCRKEETAFIPRGYELLAGVGVYKVHRAAADQGAAASRCWLEGGQLTVPADPAEADALAALLRRAHVAAALTAITDRDNEGHFMSNLGGSLDAALRGRWEARQPDNGGLSLRREDCVTLSSGALFNDVPCDQPLPFVCKLPLYPVPPAGYQYIPGLGFYKRYTKPEKYEEAKRICEGDGGHLAVPDTFEEAEELLKLAAGDGRSSYVGISDIEREGSFVTVMGQSSGELAFDNWAPDEPNNFLHFLGGEDCVELKASGLLNDINCGIALPFFCERPLPSRVR